MVWKIIKCIITAVVIVVGGAFLWLNCTFSYSSEAYYELVPTTVQQKILGLSLGVHIPENCNINRITCTMMFFDDDDPTTCTIYSNYSKNDWNKLFDGRLDSDINGTVEDYEWSVYISCDTNDNLVLYGRYEDVMNATDNLMYKDEVITKEEIWHKKNCLRALPLLIVLVIIWFPYDILRRR